MTASSSTIPPKVQEALDKAWALIQDVNTAQKVAQDARNAYNTLREQQRSVSLVAERDEALEKVTQDSQLAHDKVVVAAQVKLDGAQETFSKESQAANAVRQQAIEDANETWETKITETQRQWDLQAAGAQTKAHTADQVAASAQMALNSFCDTTHQQLGVDLKALLPANTE